jgi:hypothetical protein
VIRVKEADTEMGFLAGGCFELSDEILRCAQDDKISKYRLHQEGHIAICPS